MANSIPLVTTAIAQLQPGNPGYPRRLSALGWTDELRVRGSLSEAPAVAIVGARAASGAAMAQAHALARHLAGRGVHVVSGGALGIDGAAHRGAGPAATTVVLGSGVDVAYPRRHADLFDRIARGGGALVSMLPDGTEPRRHTFLRRNPLIAALSDVVVVVEADVRSGSLSTAHAGRDLGRIVCAYPGSRGCERLLATGAAIAERAEDIDAALDGRPRYRVAAPLDRDAAKIAEAIASGARDVDAIIAVTGLPVRTVLRALPAIEVSFTSRKQ